jgi:hypothetical protein
LKTAGRRTAIERFCAKRDSGRDRLAPDKADTAPVFPLTGLRRSPAEGNHVRRRTSEKSLDKEAKLADVGDAPRRPSGPKTIIRISEAQVHVCFDDTVMDRLASEYLKLSVISDRWRFAELDFGQKFNGLAIV